MDTKRAGTMTASRFSVLAPDAAEGFLADVFTDAGDLEPLIAHSTDNLDHLAGLGTAEHRVKLLRHRDNDVDRLLGDLLAAVGEADPHHAAVLPVSGACDQVPVFESVEQTTDTVSLLEE